MTRKKAKIPTVRIRRATDAPSNMKDPVELNCPDCERLFRLDLERIRDDLRAQDIGTGNIGSDGLDAVATYDMECPFCGTRFAFSDPWD